MVSVRAREYCLIVEFSFDIDGIVCEQVRAWFNDEDAIEGYLRKLQMKEGHWRQRNRSLGRYGIKKKRKTLKTEKQKKKRENKMKNKNKNYKDIPLISKIFFIKFLRKSY